MPFLPPPLFLLDFMYPYVQIAEADRGGFDCMARATVDLLTL